MPNLPLCHWSSQSFNLHAPSSTNVPVLLLNQPNRFIKQQNGNISWRRRAQIRQLAWPMAERQMGTGSRVYFFPRAFSSSNDVPVLLLKQPNMWICQHYQEITHYIWFYDESVFWEQRFVQWLANVISLSIIGDANDMLIKATKTNECTKRHTTLHVKYVQLKIN